MPDESDPRYTPTDPPTLEQLIGFLESTVETKAFRSKDGSRTRLEFLIDNERLAAIGASCYATGTQVAEALREALERLRYIDSVTKDYADIDTKGTTAADCQAFIANELKHVPPTHGLETTMRRRMYNATLQKLVELGVWRAAIDAKRFQNQREAERKRQQEQRARDEEILRARREWEENIRRHEERMKEKAEREARESQAGSDRGRGKKFSFGDGFEGFGADFASAFGFDRGRSWRDYYEQMYGYSDPFGGTNSSQREQSKTKASHKGRAPWYQVLGVQPNADKATIKSAWRKLASKYQPRTSAQALDKERTEKMKEINTAKDEGLKGLA
jgi:DnaJ-domain-containing protein 1